MNTACIYGDSCRSRSNVRGIFFICAITFSMLTIGCAQLPKPKPDNSSSERPVHAGAEVVAPTNTTPRQGSSSRNAEKLEVEVSSYPDFKQACLAFVTGYASHDESSKLSPEYGKKAGDCSRKVKPLVVSVTHENASNNHNGSANFNSNISSYMGDFNYETDFGKWFKVDVSNDTQPTATIMLDTIDYENVDVTGWPLRFGHLFVGLEDVISTSLGKPVFVEFDIRIRTSDVSSSLYKGYSGRRVLLGILGSWAEQSPRSNKTHFLEVDLAQSDGYTESYQEVGRPFCKDTVYDRCFYDPQGKFAEGREIRFGGANVAGEPIALGATSWTHVRLPISDLFRKLRWASPPADWDSASITGLYLAVESEGATKTEMDVKNYHVLKGS